MTAAPTITSPEQTLARVVGETGIVGESAQSIVVAFLPHYAQMHTALADAQGIEVTDATQVTQIRQAKAARLRLKEIRCAAENVRVALKADSIKRGKSIDNVANAIKGLIEPEEKRLQACEEFAERAEAARIETLRIVRADIIREFGQDPTLYPQLGTMDTATWDRLLASAKAIHEKRLEDARLAEIGRKAEAERQAEEARKLREENNRLKDEQERAERERLAERCRADAEREAALAELRKANEAREKIERTDRARKAEEDRVAREADDERRRLAAAPERDKLVAWADTLLRLEPPRVESDGAKRIVNEALEVRDRLVANITARAKALRGSTVSAGSS